MKDLKVDEIVSSLIQFRMSPEKIESSINRLKENPSQQIKYVSDEELCRQIEYKKNSTT